MYGDEYGLSRLSRLNTSAALVAWISEANAVCHNPHSSPRPVRGRTLLLQRARELGWRPGTDHRPQWPTPSAAGPFKMEPR
jgi:hypothetical protein